MASSTRPIRIAGASGSASDRRHAMAAFAKAYPTDPVHVIISDYMSEANMVTAGARKVNSRRSKETPADPWEPVGPAFETSFLEALEPALEDLAKYNIKVAVNAGSSDTEGLYKVVLNMIAKKGLDIKVAWISGDEAWPAVEKSLKSGQSNFTNIYTGETLDTWKFKPIDWGSYWYHGWRRDQLQELANAFVAGHLIECSTYVCGGNYSGFKELEHHPGGWVDIGFPIAEISANGQVVITKQKDSGGMVSVNTCSSQLVYEIQGPCRGQPRCASRRPRPSSSTNHEVGCTALGGFQAEAMYLLTGLDIPAKARMLETQLRYALLPYSKDYSLLKFHTIGSALPNSPSQDAATTIFRAFAQARTADLISPQRFLRPIIDNIMQGYPGATFHLDFRQGIPKPYFEYYVTLLPQSALTHAVHFNGRTTVIDPPSTTQTFPPRQPSQSTTQIRLSLTSFGPTTPAPLGSLIHARSGDKGSDANCGFWVPHPHPLSAQIYTWLRNLLSIETIKTLLGDEYDESRRPKIEIERFELPNLRGVHFLFRNLLDRGVTSTSSVDFLGKNVAEFLRGRVVDVPVRFLGDGAKL
ncbi:uncharacterized protein AB675_7411 [Cyphellophora attinorum]|uniref:DUF1446 domain-containing protein n=1 Tax=Cyphellophora attinorum TaxID=1664694 RepID=A0A0N1NXV4_9EURO|nr:uncharacterized protein AB675_7411 [Phialophora attinorum]KPI34557.1 hypothetical protein AB675_7411 [Phialophora attinorum]